MRERTGAEDAVGRPVEHRHDPGRIRDRRNRTVEVVGQLAHAPA